MGLQKQNANCKRQAWEKIEGLAKLSRILCDCIKFPLALDLENGLSELFKIHFPILVNVCFFQPRVYLQMKKWTVDRKSIILNGVTVTNDHIYKHAKHTHYE